jgi:5-methylcytosine-specific restriction protein A
MRYDVGNTKELSMTERAFRTPDSIAAEQRTRAMLSAFLEECGFTGIVDQRSGNRQAIDAVSPAGEPMRISIRLCWRRDEKSRDSERVRTYSAAQLLADAKGDWDGALARKIANERDRGITHVLFVQAEGDRVRFAALVPLAEVVPIWTRQRDISTRLIAEGRLGRRKKNHAMNGNSPTIWLQDDRGGQDVAAALWNHEGVVDLVHMAPAYLRAEEANEIRNDEQGRSDFEPRDDDRRKQVVRQVKERRGQRAFRDALRVRYDNRCVVTGCRLLDILEAAHISPYRGVDDNHPQNGLLLRSDIHTLFDLDLLGIEPDSLVIVLHPNVKTDVSYAALDGRRLHCDSLHRPSVEALRLRFSQFTQRFDAEPAVTSFSSAATLDPEYADATTASQS